MSRPPKHHKKFTHAQIEEKVVQRSNVPEYRAILMQCAIHEDASGVTFDSLHPAWKTLLSLVEKPTYQSQPTPTVAPKPRTPEDNKELPRERDRSRGALPGNATASPRDSKQETNVLKEQLKAELKRSNPDPFLVKTACRRCGVEDADRSRVWEVLLLTPPGVHPKEKKLSPFSSEFSAEIAHAEAEMAFDLPNQRVISRDIERTLPHEPIFQDTKTKHRMEVLLTLYCKRHNVSYKQGMNYIMAPLFLISLTDAGLIYRMYEAFIARMLSNTFSDDEFGGLQCIFALFRFLLMFHCPELCVFLDRNSIGPELYASSWFITMHANKMNPKLLLHLWDLLLLDDDSHLHYFVALALLIQHKSAILSQPPSNLPEYMSKVIPRGDTDRDNGKKKDLGETIEQLVLSARHHYRAKTPVSVRRQLKSVTSKPVPVDSPMYRALTNQQCLTVEAAELVESCYPSATTSSSNQSSLKFFLVDCRSQLQYNSGHLPCAFHLDPELLLRPEELAVKLKTITDLKQDFQFCFYAEGWPETRGNGGAHHIIAQLFLQKGLRYVTVCETGYEACHELVARSKNPSDELVDHHADACLECQSNQRLKAGERQRLAKSRANPPAAKAGGGFFSSMRSRLTDLAFGETTIAPAYPSDPEAADPINQNLPNNPSKSLRKGGAGNTTTGSGAQNDTNATSGGLTTTGVPPPCRVASASHAVRLLQTTMRNSAIAGPRLMEVVHSLAGSALALALERVPVSDTLVVPEDGGGAFTGCAASPVLTMALGSLGELAFEAALAPFLTVLDRAAARVNVSRVDPDPVGFGELDSVGGGKISVSLSALPSDAGGRHVLLFCPLLDIVRCEQVETLLRELLTRGVHLQKVMIVMLAAGRACLWGLHRTFPDVGFCCLAVEELNKRGGLSACPNLESRYSRLTENYGAISSSFAHAARPDKGGKEAEQAAAALEFELAS